MKKRFKIIAENSNALLIFITIITLILIINTSLRSNRRTNMVLIDAVNLYMNMDTDFNIEEFHRTINSFSGSYSGSEGDKAEKLLNDMAADLPASDMRRMLREFLIQYQLMLEERIEIFNTLFFFLAAGITIQFILMIISVRRQEITSIRLEDSEEFLTLLNKEREMERLRISSYLHDSILQEIGSLLLKKEMKECENAAEHLRNISESLRNLTYSISPLHLSAAGLSDTLADFARRFETETGIKSTCIINSFNEELIDKDAQLVIFRIAQEALNNIRKHANAENMTLKIVTSHPYLIIRIKDDGIGMKYSSFISRSNRKNHLGMRLMYEQAKSIGASLSGNSAPGGGTEIIIKYPLNTGRTNEKD